LLSKPDQGYPARVCRRTGALCRAGI
jgi:hypothetical protein